MRNNTQNYIIVISYISFNLFSIIYDLSKWEYGVAYNYSKLFVAGVSRSLFKVAITTRNISLQADSIATGASGTVTRANKLQTCMHTNVNES